MSTLVGYVVSSGGLIVSLAGVLIWLFVRPASRWPRRWLVAIVAVYGLASVYEVPYGLERWLVRGYRPFMAADAPPGRVAIVVLGAGEGFVHDWSGRALPFEYRDGMARVAEAARVFRLVPSAWLISSGGTTGPDDAASNGEVMRDELVQLGVPASHIVAEGASQNTRDEAVLVAPMLKTLEIDRVILVTSDIHMRRSMGLFRGVGIDPIPAIARDPISLTHEWMRFAPTPIGLDRSAAVMHEFAGLTGSWLRGWSR